MPIERNGKYYIIELAFTEDWRSIVGEMALSQMTKDLGGIIIVTAKGWDSDSIGNLVSLVGDKLGINWSWICLDKEDIEDVEEGKKTLKEYLKKFAWI